MSLAAESKQTSKRLDSVIQQQTVHVLYVIFQNLIHLHQVGHRLTCFVDDEAWTVLVREVLYALGRYYFHKLDVRILLCDLGQVLVYQTTKLVTVLVKMQDHKVLRVNFSNFSDIFVSWNFNNFSEDLFGSYFLNLFHAVNHVLPCELIVEI